MKIDEFESVFRSSVKERFHLEPPAVRSVLIVTDLDREEANALKGSVRTLLRGIDDARNVAYTTLAKNDFDDVPSLLKQVTSSKPDLIVAYRHLLGRTRELKHSLGSVLDTLTQAVDTPVLVVPAPGTTYFDAALAETKRVMVLADHLTGDDQLANWGIHLCPFGGTLILAHVEDDEICQRYLDVISKISSIDTDLAAQKIPEKLLQAPRAYIETLAEVLRKKGITDSVEPVVTMGHALTDYQRLIDEHKVDLLVFHTKDERQLAMHGMAYALTVEIQHLPLLLM